MLRSLSFAMQRILFPTKRSFTATNRATEFALDNFVKRSLATAEERECVGSARVAQLQQGGHVNARSAHAEARLGRHAIVCSYRLMLLML